MHQEMQISTDLKVCEELATHIYGNEQDEP
jgi:hypothetical protein